MSSHIDDDTLRALGNSGLSLREIGNMYGVTKQRIHQIFVARNIKREIKSVTKKSSLDPEATKKVVQCPDDNTLRSLQNLTLKEIAAMYGVSRHTVVQWFVSRKIKKNRPMLPVPTKKELLAVQHMSTVKIAKHFGVSKKTLNKWFVLRKIKKDRACIPVPTKKELLALRHMSIVKIAKHFGVNWKTVNKFFKIRKIEKPVARMKNPLTDREWESSLNSFGR